MLEKLMPVESNDAVDSKGPGKWVRAPVGIDTCAAISVTPPGVFQTPVKASQRTGEALRSACGGVIYNEGEQEVKAVTNSGYNVNGNS